MSDEVTTTLLLRLPVELKGSFQGLCNARGVSVSEELRRFMADEVASAAMGMTTKDRPSAKPVAKKIPVVRASKSKASVKKQGNPTKCDKTDDMFVSQSPKTSQKAHIDALYEKQVGKTRRTPKTATQGKFKLSGDVMAGINARDKRKKEKK